MQIKSQPMSILWSAIERFSVQGIQFFLSIIIARLVAPSDYGLVAMLGIFLAIAQTFIDSGFSNALIQKQHRTEIDFCTVFYFNIGVSILLYFVFYITSPFIAAFYLQPLLEKICKISGLTLIISSLAIVQRTKLTINLDFKTQAKASLLSVFIGGSIGVYMAWKGMGVWALVIQNLTTSTLDTIFLWFYSKWKPMLKYSWESFKELFFFGSKILFTGLLATIYANLYSLIIGKFFNTSQLGYYNRTSTIATFPSKNITSIIGRAVYPLQCTMQSDNEKLKYDFLKLISVSSYIIFPLMIGLSVLSNPLIVFLLSKKWEPAAPYLSTLSIAYMCDHIMFLSWQLLGVKGRSDLSLKSEIIKKIVSVLILFISIPFGVLSMCIGLVVYSILDILIVMFFVERLTTISLKEVIASIIPIFTLSSTMGIMIWCSICFLELPILKLLIGGLVGLSYYLILSKLYGLREFYLIKSKLTILFFNNNEK